MLLWLQQKTLIKRRIKRYPMMQLLRQIKREHQAKAKEFIPQLCYALKNEDAFLSNEDIRDRIKKDLIDIWSKTTIQNNIPDEFKDKAKQSAKEKADQKRGRTL